MQTSLLHREYRLGLQSEWNTASKVQVTMKNYELSKHRLLMGYLSAFGSIITSVSSSSCVQALKGAVPDFQLSVARSVVQLILYVIGGKLVGAEFRVKKETIPILIYLAASYIAINVGSYGAATYLPLSEVTGIVTSGLIVTAFVHSRLVYNQDITKSKIVSACVCVIGIMLTSQPSWLFTRSTTSANPNLASFKNVSEAFHTMNNISAGYVRQSSMSIGYVLAIIGGVGGGVTYDVSGIMLAGIKPVVKASYSAAFCIVGSAAFMFYLEDPVLMISVKQLMLVLGHSVLSTICSFLLILSADYIPGPSLSVVYSSEMVTMLLAQYTIMHSVMPGNYNWIEVVGCLIITLGASMSSALDIFASNAKSDELP